MTQHEESCVVGLLRDGDLDLHSGLCSVQHVSAKPCVASAARRGAPMEMDVICLTTSAGECRSMRRL